MLDQRRDSKTVRVRIRFFLETCSALGSDWSIMDMRTNPSLGLGVYGCLGCDQGLAQGWDCAGRARAGVVGLGLGVGASEPFLRRTAAPAASN